MMAARVPAFDWARGHDGPEMIVCRFASQAPSSAIAGVARSLLVQITVGVNRR
jgi:hypothetical protein